MMNDKRSWDLRLGYLIHDVSRLRRVTYDRELAPLGITRSQWWVLAFISRNDGLPQTQLAHELDVGKVALGSLIDRLQTAGFVERRADEKDRRVKRVFLTAKALKLITEIAPINDSFNARILKGIPRKDLELTSQTLYAMKTNLLALVAERSGGDLDALDEEEEATAPRRRPRVAAL
jgi:MarR family transcriptional regulator, transcriptional regulator for hemolysin